STMIRVCSGNSAATAGANYRECWLTCTPRAVRFFIDRSPSACCILGYESSCPPPNRKPSAIKVTMRRQTGTSRTTNDGKCPLADGLSRKAVLREHPRAQGRDKH